VFESGAAAFDAVLFPGDPWHVTGLIRKAGLVRGPILLAKTHPWVAAEKAAFTAVMLALYLLAIRGVFLAMRGAFRGHMQEACLWLLLGTFFYFLIVSGVAGGQGASSRYRVPIMPIVCILAAAGTRRTIVP
jgi:hypothetical protein